MSVDKDERALVARINVALRAFYGQEMHRTMSERRYMVTTISHEPPLRKPRSLAFTVEPEELKAFAREIVDGGASAVLRIDTMTPADFQLMWMQSDGEVQ